MALDDLRHVEAVAILRRVIEEPASISLPGALIDTIEGWLAENHPPPAAYIAALGQSAGTPLPPIAPAVARSFLYRHETLGAHVHVSVFAGQDEQHRAHCGTLIFRTEEFDVFRDRVQGPGHTFTEKGTPQ